MIYFFLINTSFQLGLFRKITAPRHPIANESKKLKNEALRYFQWVGRGLKDGTSS
jgi:hypothetical protein